MKPSDFGPIYAETDLSRFPVEPWNTASNLIFLALLIFFRERIRGHERRHPALTLGLPILLVGFIGGTLFHATRDWNLWLYLDFIPIFVLCILASLHFWILLGAPVWAAVGLILVPPFLTSTIRRFAALPRQFGISLGYVGMALAIVLPAVLLCRRRGWRDSVLLFGAVGSFAVAVTCRVLDGAQLLPMGTHFLWHLFGGVSAGLMMEFMYRSDLEQERRS